MVDKLTVFLVSLALNKLIILKYCYFLTFLVFPTWRIHAKLVLQFLFDCVMHPVFYSEFIGLDWPILLVGHIIMFWYLAVRLDWSWIPLTDHEKSCGSKGDAYRAQVSSLEKTFQNS